MRQEILKSVRLLTTNGAKDCIIATKRKVDARAVYIGVLIIGYAVLIHLVTGTTLILNPDAGASTGPSSVVQLFGSTYIAGAAMLIAAGLAIVAHLHAPIRGWAFWPQQGLLMVAAIGAFVAVVMGNYADGVVRPTLFIATDQLPVMLLPFFHALAIILSRDYMAE
jgi:hypothetical protein